MESETAKDVGNFDKVGGSCEIVGYGGKVVWLWHV